MKRFLLRIWRILPPWMERIASAIIRPRFHVVAGAIILNEQGQLLLCKHTYRRLHPWGLPGGDIHFGEDPAEAVRRELWEETGFSRAGDQTPAGGEFQADPQGHLDLFVQRYQRNVHSE